MLILKWKQSHWWIAGLGGVGWGREMSSYLDVREPNHQLSSAGLGFGICLRPWCGGEQMLCCGSRGALWELGCNVLTISRWLVPRWPLGILFYCYFFLKMLLLIVFFLRTTLFPSSLAILIIFIQNLHHAQYCAKCLWVLSWWFLISDDCPLWQGHRGGGKRH